MEQFSFRSNLHWHCVLSTGVVLEPGIASQLFAEILVYIANTIEQHTFHGLRICNSLSKFPTEVTITAHCPYKLNICMTDSNYNGSDVTQTLATLPAKLSATTQYTYLISARYCEPKLFHGDRNEDIKGLGSS